jgi:Transposase IS66 family
LSKTIFFCPELEYINKCAYSDYQRERVYVRTSHAVRKSQKRKLRAGKRRLKVNQEVECGPPGKCPECGSKQIDLCSFFQFYMSRRVVFDLKFTSSGIKRWLVRYSSLRYQCGQCQATFLADQYPVARSKLGPNLSAWAIYHHVALRQTHDDVVQSLNDLFGFSFCASVLSRLKPRVTEIYRPVYEKLKDKLRHGPLAHADETKALVKGHSGYVWAFTNLEEVVYVDTSTRDGDILEKVLEGFTGVLVSDFYSAYDGVKCPQQKCLRASNRTLRTMHLHRS